MENLHIVFWLFKDLAWCLLWKPLGIIMIFPTLIIALVIAWRTRKIMSELCHNLAIAVWIIANSYWMISEFYHFDEKPMWLGFEYRYLALIPFMIGIMILGFYYIIWKPRNKYAQETM
ncbi:MAG: hypothetical protein KF781_07190 [Chitinophagaceae bacterium]|nr:hypothetical protein [Chitinophagaceae bacterium]MCW5903992.1 hypothetical protein [Chitinophagaceae bacterium]